MTGSRLARGEHTGRALFKGLAFASPFIIGFVLLYAWPILASGWYSFTDFSLFKAPKFVGLANYERMLADAKFWKSLYNTLFFTFVGVPVDIAISLAGAHILNQKLKGQPLWRALVYLPSIVPAVAAGFLWRWLLNAQYGFVNEILSWFHIPQPNWLLDSAWGGVSVIVLMLWTVGGTMLIYLAALKNVPPDLYEAAEIDGAGPIRKFLFITWPMVSPVTLFQVIVLMIAFLQVFTQPFVLSKDPGLGTQSATGPGQFDAQLFHLPVPERFCVPQDGLCFGHGLGAARRHPPDHAADPVVGQEVGVL